MTIQTDWPEKTTDEMIADMSEAQAKFVIRALIAADKVRDYTIRQCINLATNIGINDL